MRNPEHFNTSINVYSDTEKKKKRKLSRDRYIRVCRNCLILCGVASGQIKERRYDSGGFMDEKKEKGREPVLYIKRM